MQGKMKQMRTESTQVPWGNSPHPADSFLYSPNSFTEWIAANPLTASMIFSINSVLYYAFHLSIKYKRIPSSRGCTSCSTESITTSTSIYPTSIKNS